MITYINITNYMYISRCHLASNCFSMGVHTSQFKGRYSNYVY